MVHVELVEFRQMMIQDAVVLLRQSITVICQGTKISVPNDVNVPWPNANSKITDLIECYIILLLLF
jgi:hypothetical protein